MFSSKDNLLSPKAFEQLMQAAHERAFEDIRSDIDGVVYPQICREVPELVRQEVEFLASKPVKSIFMRRSPEGVHCPQIHHTDNSMGKTSMMLYLEERDGSGTAFVRHHSLGIAYAPKIDALLPMLHEDQNNPEAWVVHSFCEARANRACIFDAGWFHRAEPMGGYGEGPSSRCVLTAFCD